MKRTVLFCDGQKQGCDIFSFPSQYYDPNFSDDLTYDLRRVAEHEDKWVTSDDKIYCLSCFKKVFSTHDPFIDTLENNLLLSLRGNLDHAASNIVDVLLDEYPQRMEAIFGDDIYQFMGMMKRNGSFSSSQKELMIKKIEKYLENEK